ncbi:MAG: hypothetical protein ACP5VQ_06060 [Phycisphaerae bacterium]
MSRWAAVFLLVVILARVSQHATGANVKLETVSAATLSARANQWNAAIVGLSNTGYQAVHADLCVRMDRMSNVEFVQPVWLPARSAETISLPVFCPLPRLGQKATDYTAWLATGKGSRIIARDSGGIFTPIVRNTTLAVTNGNDQATVDLAVQMRQQDGLSSIMAYTNSQRLPFLASEYDGVYAVVTARRRMALTGQQLAALRRWIVSGGRLWLQAQRVHDRFEEELLGSAWTITKVGQTHTATLRFSGRGIRKRVVHLKKAIHFVYLLAPGYTTLEKINGWPAVVTRHIGLGEIYVCAINGRGLLNHNGKGGAVLWPIVRRFYATPRFHVPTTILKHSAISQIGYRISRRMVIGGVLIGMTVLLVLVGFFLARKNRLERLAPVAILLAVVAGLVLIVNGKLNRGKVKLTLSSYQIAVAAPAEHLLVLRGFTTLFSPQAQGAELTTSSAFQFNPETTFAKQPDVRMVVRSNGKFQWEKLNLPSAATIDVPYNTSRQADLITPVIARFGPLGLLISGQGSMFSNLRNSVIVAPRGAMALARLGAGRSLAGSAEILPAGQFVRSSLLTRLEQRHNSIAAQLFTAGGPPAPLLLGWRSSVMPPVQLTQHPVVFNQTLLVIPVDVRHSAPGTNVAIAWPYLSYRLVSGPGEQAPAPVYDVRNHRWLRDLSSPAKIYLRFQLPPQVLPLKITSAVLTLKVNAPARPVSVMAPVQGRWVRIGDTPNGTGTVLLHPTAAEMSDVSKAGGWRCAVMVGGSIDPNSTWHIATIRLSVAGTVQSKR